jgi:hypothetical protein
VTQSQPSPLQVKKSSHTTVVAVVMLLIGLGIGLAAGWSIGQNQSQVAPSSNYTRITVLIGGSNTTTLGGLDYTFFYKYNSYDYSTGKTTPYNQTYPIEVHSSKATYYSQLPATQGGKYDVLGLEVDIIEVADTYVILRVKPL